MLHLHLVLVGGLQDSHVPGKAANEMAMWPIIRCASNGGHARHISHGTIARLSGTMRCRNTRSALSEYIAIACWLCCLAWRLVQRICKYPLRCTRSRADDVRSPRIDPVTRRIRTIVFTSQVGLTGGACRRDWALVWVGMLWAHEALHLMDDGEAIQDAASLDAGFPIWKDLAGRRHVCITPAETSKEQHTLWASL